MRSSTLSARLAEHIIRTKIALTTPKYWPLIFTAKIKEQLILKRIISPLLMKFPLTALSRDQSSLFQKSVGSPPTWRGVRIHSPSPTCIHWLFCQLQLLIVRNNSSFLQRFTILSILAPPTHVASSQDDSQYSGICDVQSIPHENLGASTLIHRPLQARQWLCSGNYCCKFKSWKRPENCECVL